MKKILIFCILVISILETNGQESLARMKMDYVSTGENAGIQFHKGEFIVIFKPYNEKNTWAVWNKDGDSGYLDTLAFQIIHGKPIFKLKSNPRLLKKTSCNHHTRVLSRQFKINYCTTIKRVIRKRSDALTKFFDLIPEVDAALATIHARDTWTIINLYTDDEFYIWLKTLDTNRLKQFMGYLKDGSVAYPITRYAEYLSLYYPKSWTILKNFK